MLKWYLLFYIISDCLCCTVKHGLFEVICTRKTSCGSDVKQQLQSRMSLKISCSSSTVSKRFSEVDLHNVCLLACLGGDFEKYVIFNYEDSKVEREVLYVLGLGWQVFRLSVLNCSGCCLLILSQLHPNSQFQNVSSATYEMVQIKHFCLLL